jgi:RNA polymerase sigma-54 factor
MKHALQLRTSQQLAMTPQLQQAIRLLQLPAAELNLEIREALESNMMLELEDETGGDTTPPEEATPGPAATDPSEMPLGSNATDATRLGESLPMDERWDEAVTPAAINTAEPTGGPDPLENRADDERSLQAYLDWQLAISKLSARDRQIADTLVDAIDERGHLTEPLESIQQTLNRELQADEDELRAVLAFIQHLDPVGIGARDATEALTIQVDALPADTPGREAAREVIQQGLGLLAEGQYGALQKRLGLDEGGLEQAITLVQQLDPHPGSAFSQPRTEYIVPDCFVRRVNGRWEVEINPEASPALRVNSYYASLVRRGDSSADNSLLRQHLQEARWLIKSLHSRANTLQRVAQTIVERQQAFLEQGEEAMQPLVLREVAEAVAMHESTISRITTHKYMHTPMGTLEFKYFFSSHVPTADGGECSATAIRARIRRLVAAEDPTRPLSDARLTQTLQDEGIHVARRTVAKYREVMGIASSTDRRRPARP